LSDFVGIRNALDCSMKSFSFPRLKYCNCSNSPAPDNLAGAALPGNSFFRDETNFTLAHHRHVSAESRIEAIFLVGMLDSLQIRLAAFRERTLFLRGRSFEDSARNWALHPFHALCREGGRAGAQPCRSGENSLAWCVRDSQHHEFCHPERTEPQTFFSWGW